MNTSYVETAQTANIAVTDEGEYNVMTELTREMPADIPSGFLSGGVPIFTAFDCAVVEYATGKSFIYKGVNLNSGRTETLLRRPSPLEHKHVPAMMDKLRKSPIAGARRLEADKPFNCKEPMTFSKLRDIQNEIFLDVLPKYGYAIREKQVELAEHILDEICRHSVTLAEAEVGTGKTLAYLLPAILAKRGRANDFWNHDYYDNHQFIDAAYMPVVVSTSSIALQCAIIVPGA